MVFKNRLEAALLLVSKLNQYKNQHVIVAGIPRGAIPMARLIARKLNAELTAVLVRKISAPHNQEFAIGSIGLSGEVYLSPWASNYADTIYIKKACVREREILLERQKRYGIKPPHYRGRTIIIIDDGIATGATTLSAVKEARSWGGDKIVLAVPVSSKKAAISLKHEVDEFIALTIPDFMNSVGEFYRNFPQISDQEVEEILKGANNESSLEFF